MINQKAQTSLTSGILRSAVVLTITLLGIIVPMTMPPTFAYSPGGETIWEDRIQGTHELVATVGVFQWEENDQPGFDRYTIDVWIDTEPDRWFNIIGLDIDLGGGSVYSWAPYENFYLFPLGWVDAVGENTKDFRLEEFGPNSLNQEIRVAIEVPNDSGLSVTVTVTVRYYSLKEPITWDAATTGWMSFADEWPG